MGEERLVKRVYRETVECNRRRVRPQRGWKNEKEELLMGRGLSEAGNKEDWDRMVFRSE